MKNLDKIIELIEKEKFSENDVSILKQLLEDDVESRDFYKTYIKLGKAFRLSKHLSHDELGDYVLIKNGLEPGNKLNMEKVPVFEVHLKRCEQCSKLMQNFNADFSDLESFVAGQVSHQNKETEHQPLIAHSRIPKFNFTRYAFAGISSFAVIILALIATSNFTTPKYYDLAAITDEPGMMISRGRTTDDFELSIKALEEKNFDSAIEFLKKDIEQNKNDETIFYSHYILGLTYLETSEKNIFGLFPTFNKSYAEYALDNFKKTVELNNSGKFNNVNLDAYFYSAKAELMMENTKSAKDFLEIVITEKGSRLSEASEIIKALK
jgi:tetratricopeptide (TPR) repeat protein